MDNGTGSNSSSPSKPTMPTTSENGNGMNANVSNVAEASDSGSSAASHRDLLPQRPGSVANEESSANSSSGTVMANVPGPPSTAMTTPGALGSMGPPPPPPHHVSTPAVIPSAQIRSRITVVCAECKRLKLKCDRRMPCGSCSKRDTIARCIYSPAAAEKVDVQSIHNRLLVVEGNMANLPTILANTVAGNINSSLVNSAASTPLPSSTSLPSTVLGSASAAGNIPSRLQSYSNMNIGLGIRMDSSVGAGPGPSTKRARILARDTRGASVVVNLDGVTGLWMGELETELGRDSSARTSLTGKRASASTQLKPIDRAAPPTSSYVPQLVLHATAAPPESPAIVLSRHLGFNIIFASADHVPLGPNGDDTSSEDSYAALISQLTFRLPSEHLRGELMRRLEATLAACGAPSIPFRWFHTRVESLFTKGKGRSSVNVPGLTSTDVPTLSLVAAAAAAFAIGALSFLEDQESGRLASISSSTSVQSPSPGVAANSEVHASTPQSLYRLARLALQLHIERHGQASYDPEFIYAYVLSARYLLLAKSRANCTARPSPDPCLPPEIPPLVGELVWHARVMGLGVDPDDFEETDPLNSIAPTFASSLAAVAGPVPPSIPSASSSVSGAGGGSERSRGKDRRVKREEGDYRPFGSGTGRQGSMTLFMKEIRRRLWWEVLWLDLLVTDNLGHSPMISAEEFSTRLPTDVDDEGFDPSSTSLPPPTEKSNLSFFIVKCRLYEFLRVIHVRKSREVRTVLVDGMEDADFVTARALANELTQWLDNIPEKFKITDIGELTSLSQPDTPPMASLLPAPGSVYAHSPSEPSPSTIQSPMPMSNSPMLLAQRCELLMITQHLITRLFLPRPRITGTNNSDRPPDKSARPGPQLSGLFGIEPALVVVSAAQVLHDTYLRTRCIQSTFYRVSFPRIVFDAAVVLAYIAIQQPLYTAGSVLDAVQVALRILRQFNSGTSELNASESSPNEAVMVVERLLGKAKAAHRRSNPIVSGMKRKHEEVDDGSSEGFRQDFRLPFSGAGVINTEISEATQDSAMDSEDIVFIPPTSHRSDTSGHASAKTRYSHTSEPRSSASWAPLTTEVRQALPKHKHSIPQYSVRNRSGMSREESGRSRAGSVSSSRHSHSQTAPMSVQPSVVPRPQHHVQHSDPPTPASMYHSPTGAVHPQQFRPPETLHSDISVTPSRPDSAYSVPPGMNFSQPFTPVQTSPTHPYDYYTPPSTSYSRPSSQHQQSFEAAIASHTSVPDLSSSSGHGMPENPQERHYRSSMDQSTVGMQPIPNTAANPQPFHSHGLGLDQTLIQPTPGAPPPLPQPQSQPQPQPQHPHQDQPWTEPVQIHGPQAQQHHPQSWDGNYPYWNNNE